MGGYKWGSNEWKRTKREKMQVREEHDLVEGLRKNVKTFTRNGYSQDEFITPDDVPVPENVFAFDADAVLDIADAQSAGSSDSGDNLLDWDSSSDDSDAPEGGI